MKYEQKGTSIKYQSINNRVVEVRYLPVIADYDRSMGLIYLRI